MDTGRQRCNVPLTFGTVARKLSKLFISNRDKKQEVIKSYKTNVDYSLLLLFNHQVDVKCLSHPSPHPSSGSVVDSSSQTVETSFTTCDLCSDKTAVLLSVTSGLSEVCREVCGVCEEREWRVVDGREREWLEHVNKHLTMLKTHSERYLLINNN